MESHYTSPVSHGALTTGGARPAPVEDCTREGEFGVEKDGDIPSAEQHQGNGRRPKTRVETSPSVPPSPPPGGRYFGDLADLHARGIPYHTDHLRRLEGKRQFPPRIKLGPAQSARVVWDLQDISAWQADPLSWQAAQRAKVGEGTA
jgi:hypothetical protein